MGHIFELGVELVSSKTSGLCRGRIKSFMKIGVVAKREESVSWGGIYSATKWTLYCLASVVPHGIFYFTNYATDLYLLLILDKALGLVVN